MILVVPFLTSQTALSFEIKIYFAINRTKVVYLCTLLEVYSTKMISMVKNTKMKNLLKI